MSDNIIKSMKNSTKLLMLIITLLFSLSAVSAFDGNQSKVLRYPYEEGGGDILIDVVGDFDSNVFGNPSWVTSSRWDTYAIKFDGNNDYSSSQSTRDTPDEMTVNTWVYFDALNKNQQIWDIVDTQESHGLYFNSTNDELVFEYINTSGERDTVSVESPVSFNKGTWQMMTIEIGFASNRLLYYRNSQERYNSTLPTNISKIESNKRLYTGATGDNLRHFDGKYDEFRIFQGILTQDQLDELYINNEVTLLTPANETQTTYAGTEKANLINYTFPKSETLVKPPLTIEAGLNTQADCDIYLDGVYEETIIDKVSFSYEKFLLEEEEHSYRVHCYYYYNDTKYYDDTGTIDFEYKLNTDAIDFQLYQNGTLTDRTDLYLTTPCFRDAGGIIDDELQKDTSFYIQRVVEGKATFNLKNPKTYEFCLVRGKVNKFENNFTQDYDIVDVDKQTQLGELRVDNSTENYYLELSAKDLYPKYSPMYWDVAKTVFLRTVVTFILSISLMTVGVRMNSPKIVMAGAIILLGGLGISISPIVATII